ncbi:hypothetical protein CPT_Moonbeam203 [Bacillus phage Moonbeam]|uniref:Uncharacterized protein n=1 Tax=Bacillus phage Moonbeam TaxID=1540091 RepID=A0A0A0RST4_9CAUD|nr:hypothetical protein CPT_Moonbeam203 [Bacillus phage Moonbeam]AIW03601.1 hypothetical protein CPT_Moonbeam203 [Bacillus phage Moonbeam]
MGGYIALQPNGLYCRYSTVVEALTHINMTREDYVSNFTGTVRSREEAEDILGNYLHSFSTVEKMVTRLNVEEAEWKRIKTHVTLPKNSIFVYPKVL